MKRKDKNRNKEQKKVQHCSVCYYKLAQGQHLQQMHCVGCEQVFHKYCYAPDFRQGKNIKFKCDLCKKRSVKGKNKEEKVDCSFCGMANGLFKEISNGEWMHVLCALTAPRVNVINYQSLTFSNQNNSLSKKATKHKCLSCNHKLGFAQCCEVEECKQKRHLNCLMYENSLLRQQDQKILYVNKLGLLDRNQGSLIYKLKKQFSELAALALIQTAGKEPQFYVCKQHNGLNFIWCYCGKQVSEEQGQCQCQTCFRWYHIGCKLYYDTIGEGDDSIVTCKACKNNQIYMKNMSIPELIAQAIKVQTKQVWDKTHVKYLDHFSLKHSIQIDKKMKLQANRLTIQRYFLRKELNKFDKQTKDEIKQGQILQILYYLFKKQIKNEAQITLQDIQLMLSDITSSSEKSNLKFSLEKPQKMWKSFLENKLKKLKKDDFRQIKTKITRFERQLATPNKSEIQIVSELYPVLKLLSSSQIVLSAFKNMNQKGLNSQILEFLVSVQPQKSQLQHLLRSFKILTAARKNKSIDEDHYLSVKLKLYPFLSEPKIKDLKKIQQKFMKGVKQQHKLYEKRRQILLKIQQKQEQQNYQEFKVLRNKGINCGSLFPINSKAFNYQVDSIEFQIRKKRILKKNNIINFSELGLNVQTLRWLLFTNSRLGVMQKQERKTLQVLYQKSKLFNNIFIYVKQLRKKLNIQNMQMGVLQQAYSSQSQNKELKDSKTQQFFLKQLQSIINDWPLSHQCINIGLFNLYQASIKYVSFTQQQQKLIVEFVNKLVLEVDRQLKQSNLRLKPSLLKYIVQVVKYFKNQEKWQNFTKIYYEYMQWKQKLDQDFLDFQIALESPQRTKILINVVDQKLVATAYINQCLDLSSEIKKLKLIRTWAVFSQKMLVPEKKATLAAIQAAKSLMEKIYYPKNKIRKQVQKLDLQSKILNKRIGRFLQKQKYSDMDYHEELKFLQAKITTKQAEQLQKDLQNSQLDVEIQLMELKEQLNQCRYFPTITQFCEQSKKLQTLAELRRKIIQSPFLVCKLKDYQILLRAYYSKKCEEYSGNITKKQYFRLIECGGLSSYEFAKKTQTLRKIYKDIQIAQKQIILIKPRPQLLLSYDLKKIKADLLEDPAELNRVEKYFYTANRCRQKLNSYKQERADIEKYNALQAELNKIPINLKITCNEINQMKRELQEFSNKIRIYFCDQSQIARLQFCSPFCSQLLNKYQKCGIKNEIMNKFQIIVTKARQIAEIFNNLSFENYKTFSLLCTSSTQLQKNDQIYCKRMAAFQQIYEHYISNSDPLIEIGLALLTEGGFLIRRPQVAQQLLTLLLNVNNKILKCKKRITIQAINNKEEQNQDGEIEDQFNSEQEGYDDQNLESDSEEDDQDDVQNIDLDDEQDLQGESSEELQNKEDEKEKEKSKKRVRPNQYVISDSDQ